MKSEYPIKVLLPDNEEILSWTSSEISAYFNNLKIVYSTISTARRRRKEREMSIQSAKWPCNIKGWISVEAEK